MTDDRPCAAVVVSEEVTASLSRYVYSAAGCIGEIIRLSYDVVGCVGADTSQLILRNRKE